MARFEVTLGLSHRRAAWLCSTTRSGMFYESRMDWRDRHLATALRIVSRRYPAWGYRLSCGFLRLRGWKVNPKRVYRVWQRIGLSLPPYRPKRKTRTGAKLDRLALRRNDIWSKDFVHDRYHDAEKLRCLTVKDEATGFCLAIKVDRSLRSEHVKEVLHELITRYGRPRAIRCDNGAEFLAEVLCDELKRQSIVLANIEPGKPWQNGSNESFNGTFRKECLNAEIFASLIEARVIIEQWRCRYNEERPHSSQNYITPAMAFFGLTKPRKTYQS